MPPDAAERKLLESTVKSAQQHMDIIEEFGRYPSRNDVLGRKSTPEELKHLEANPHGFSKPPSSESSVQDSTKGSQQA
jgi:uncharacterized protein (DUF924 family)